MANAFFKLLFALSIFLFCLAVFIGVMFKGSPSGLVLFLFATSGISFMSSLALAFFSFLGLVFSR